MHENANEILEAALALPEENRVDIIEKLLESLTVSERPQFLDEWALEAERRIRAYEAGNTQAIPGEEVFRSVLPTEETFWKDRV